MGCCALFVLDINNRSRASCLSRKVPAFHPPLRYISSVKCANNSGHPILTLQVAFTGEERWDSDTTYMYVVFFLSFPPNSNKPTQLEEQERQIVRLQHRIASLEGTPAHYPSTADAQQAGAPSTTSPSRYAPHHLTPYTTHSNTPSRPRPRPCPCLVTRHRHRLCRRCCQHTRTWLRSSRARSTAGWARCCPSQRRPRCAAGCGAHAVLQDAVLAGAAEVVLFAGVRPMMVQSLLRHAMARGAIPPSTTATPHVAQRPRPRP